MYSKKPLTFNSEKNMSLSLSERKTRAAIYNTKKVPDGIKATIDITVDQIKELQALNVPSYFQGAKTKSLTSTRFPIMKQGANWNRWDENGNRFYKKAINMDNTTGRKVNCPGPRVAQLIATNYQCFYVSREDRKKTFSFGVIKIQDWVELFHYETGDLTWFDQSYTVDHVISRKRLFWGYLNGIIEKNQINCFINLVPCRRWENARKGEIARMNRVIDRIENKEVDYDRVERIMNEIKRWSGLKVKTQIGSASCKPSLEFWNLISTNKKEESGIGPTGIVRLAFYYKGHELCNSEFYQKEIANDPSLDINWTIKMIKKYHYQQ